MPDGKIPFRLQVLNALTECLKGITPDQGYDFDLSDFPSIEEGVETVKSRVLRGRDWYGDGDPLPMISILEVPRNDDQEDVQPDNPTLRGPWEIMIQGFVKNDPENPTDPAHLLMAEVKTALGIEKKRRKSVPGGMRGGVPDYLGLGDRQVNCIEGFAFDAGTVRPPDTISPTAYFYLVLRLKMLENPSEPYV